MSLTIPVDKLASLTYAPTTGVYTVYQRGTTVVLKDFFKSLAEAADWCAANGWVLQSPAPIPFTTPSITKQPLVQPKLSREVSMEQLCSAYVDFMNSLDPRDDLFVSNEENEKFHNSMWLFLEESLGWPDYASHN